MKQWIARIIAGFTALFTWISISVGPYTPPVEAPDMTDKVVDYGETYDIISNGFSDYVIIKGENCTESESTAATTLQEYLKKISGVTLSIFTDDRDAALHEIIVGKTTREGSGYTVDRSALGNDGVYLKTVGEKLVISGGELRGTLYAVYTFLEDYLGCGFYTHDLIVTPQKAVISAPVNLNYTYVPPFEFRDTDWLSPKYTDYSVANKLNSTTYRALDNSVGGGIGYTGGLCHTFTTTFVNRDKYFASHPEYFALHDGKRVNSQLCLTNPDVLQLVIDEVQAILDQNPNATMISLTQWDDDNYCECDACKSLDEAHGSHQGTNLTFVNKVAEHFKDKYPNLQFDTFAYWYTRTPPENLKPAANVIIRLCSIECCFVHALDDPNCEENVSFANDIKAWSKIADKLYIWDYTTNYANFNGPFPDLQVLQANAKFFRDNNVVGIYEEGNYTAAVSNGEFAELRAYLLANLLWNPDADVQDLTRKFCKAYYGNAAKYIMEYLNIIEYKASHNVSHDKHFGKSTHVKIFCSMDDPEMRFLTNKDVQYLDKLWEQAKSSDLQDWQLKNVRLSEISWRYWKIYNNASEFTIWQLPKDRKAEVKKLYDDMVSLGVKQIREGGAEQYLSSNPDLSKMPQRWTVQHSGE